MMQEAKEIYKMFILTLVFFLLILIAFMVGQANQQYLEDKFEEFTSTHCPRINYSVGFGGISAGWWVEEPTYNAMGSYITVDGFGNNG